MINRRLYYVFAVVAMFCVLFYTGCNSETPEPDVEQLHPSVAPHWKTGQRFFSENDWIECGVGDMPLIISAPHGGRLRPEEIPDRSCPNITTVLDTNTEELAQEMERILVEEYGVRPYMIVAQISRRKIDLNREINEATCGNEKMKEVWRQYHAFIDTALHTAVANHGRALFIDLHAHGHEIQRLEIGYSLGASQLGQIYSGVNLTTLGKQSSLQNLLRLQPQVSFQDLISGDLAFGTLMDAEGFPSVPSKHDPYPMAGEPFFNGGHNTRYYTGPNYPNVYGWQIEANNQGVRNNAANRTRFAKAFAKVITHYLNQTAN